MRESHWSQRPGNFLAHGERLASTQPRTSTLPAASPGTGSGITGTNPHMAGTVSNVALRVVNRRCCSLFLDRQRIISSPMIRTRSRAAPWSRSSPSAPGSSSTTAGSLSVSTHWCPTSFRVCRAIPIRTGRLATPTGHSEQFFPCGSRLQGHGWGVIGRSFRPTQGGGCSTVSGPIAVTTAVSVNTAAR